MKFAFNSRTGEMLVQTGPLHRVFATKQEPGMTTWMSMVYVRNEKSEAVNCDQAVLSMLIDGCRKCREIFGLQASNDDSLPGGIRSTRATAMAIAITESSQSAPVAATAASPANIPSVVKVGKQMKVIARIAAD